MSVVSVTLAEFSGSTAMLRQPETEAGTLTEFTGNLNGAAEFFDDPPGDEQAQTGSLAGGFRAEKRLEYFIQMLPGNARSAVANRDHLAVADIFYNNGNGSCGIDSVYGICQQIQQHLSYLIGVTPDALQ